MNTLPDLIAAGRADFIRRHKRAPTVLAIGRWDARELAQHVVRTVGASTGITASRFLHDAREGVEAWDAQVKVDGRVGRMPASLWWHE